MEYHQAAALFAATTFIEGMVIAFLIGRIIALQKKYAQHKEPSG